MEAKPKSRKVAWVVLGVVVLGAVISIAAAWDTILLNVLYCDHKTVELEWIYSSTGNLACVSHKPQDPRAISILIHCPPGAVRARFLRKTVSWMPGPESMVVFLREQDEMISYCAEDFLP